MNAIFATGNVLPVLPPTAVAVGDSALMPNANDMFIADGHVDLLYHLEGKGGGAPFDADMEGRQVDLPKLLRAGVRLFFSSLFTFPSIAEEDAFEIRRQMGEYKTIFQRFGDKISLVKTKGDIENIWQAGKIGVVMHLEGANALFGSKTLLDELFEFGLRSVGLTHSEENAFATGDGGDPKRGLTQEGRQLIEKLQQLGVLIDLAHANALTTSQVLKTKPRRVFVSHTGANAVYPSPRNITDDHARQVVEKGGTIGVFFSKGFLVGKEATSYPLEAVSRHIRHLLNICGSDGVAIGSDFGGISSGLPEGMGDIGKIGRLFELLSSEGVEPETLSKIAGGNLMRFLRQNLPEGD